jgi:hypothetical protein
VRRVDFFSYYIQKQYSKIEMDEFTFKIYEALLFEAQEFFRKEDRIDGTVFFKVFTMLYINENAFDGKDKRIQNFTYKGRIDRVAYTIGIDQKTLYKYRLRYDRYAFSELEEKGLSVILSCEKYPIKIVKSA